MATQGNGDGERAATRVVRGSVTEVDARAAVGYEALMAALGPEFDGVALRELTDEQIDLLGGVTGHGPERIPRQYRPRG